MRKGLFFFALLILAACGGTSDVADEGVSEDKLPPPLPPIKTTDLPAFFDCVRESHGVLIAAHRGGPAPGFPENALETLQYGYDRGIRVFEIDMATSRDGVLFLMHDRSLRRTTNMSGSTGKAYWSDIALARLVDNEGDLTVFHPPTLADALIWARDNGAILELDKKDATRWEDVINAVRDAGAENHVLLITYSNNDAGLVQDLAPEMMLTTGARGDRDMARLRRLGVNPAMTIAWTGTERPDSLAWDRLARERVEAAFGTLGRSGERLDDVYWADDDPSEYRDMIRDGLVLLATDEPYRLADALSEDDHALNTCAG